MAVAFRDCWPAVAAGAINDTDIVTRQLAVMRAETVASANRIYWTTTGLDTPSAGMLVGGNIPPWVNVIVGDRVVGGWSQYGRYGPIVVANGAGSDQDVYFWETERSGGNNWWRTTMYNAGIDSDGTVRGHSRGRQFNAFALPCAGAVIDV